MMNKVLGERSFYLMIFFKVIQEIQDLLAARMAFLNLVQEGGE